ncbi:integral membrane sensor signal transduction histidine kinase [Paenibacillus curdlanolyticus YK9]|uniref:Integral membrane sensor signal transduction histidine kinase n=1 Tax=Paenibacillus curdlanolyticus YK9 TaxID=717606 RepID=E0I5Z2_9BACL|nr:sensor histidine kinase [Paenibacillus curdlanolyticus]EFM12384.1 integral membrane sensor signal transduction histidine kinase [Paenibacillus curdlanolyticus YK9]
MRHRLQNMNTLRNQILAMFLLVMAIVLCFVGLTTYTRVSALIKNNAERQLKQTANEATGRLETLYRQLDMLSSQVMTTTEVQQLLLQHTYGQRASLQQRQSLMQSVSTFQVYSDGIQAFDLYANNYSSMFPLDDTTLNGRIGSAWIQQIDLARGKLVWIGQDPKDPNYFLAVRQVRLIDHWFASGGYLLIRVNRSYFDLGVQGDQQRDELMLLLDRNQLLITSNFAGNSKAVVHSNGQTVTIRGKEYIQVDQKSELTGWKLVILTPVSTVLEGITVLRTAIIVSGCVGFLICLLCSFFLSSMITRPILRLIKTMRGSRLGEMRPSPEVQSTVEINELTKTYNQMVEHMNELIQVIYEKELVRSRSELKALQAQINPHFLYNTLEALFWSLQEKEEEELAELVVAMSELFRYTIGSDGMSEWVTFSAELEHIERYMQLMQLRMGDRLSWNIEVAPECLNIRIPKLIIQPIVENAILHGIGNKKGPGCVSLTIQADHETSGWLVQVTDDGPGMDEQTVHSLMNERESAGITNTKGNGMAIDNVNKRLHLYYKDSSLHGLSIRSALGEGTQVSFLIPGDEGWHEIQ